MSHQARDVDEIRLRTNLPLSKERRRRLEQTAREDLVGAKIIVASVSVSATGELSIDELILRQGDFGATFAIGVDAEGGEMAVDRYTGPGRWSRDSPPSWRRVDAADLEED